MGSSGSDLSLRHHLLRQIDNGTATLPAMGAKDVDEECADFAEQNRCPERLWGSLLGDVSGPSPLAGPSAVRHPWLHVDANGAATLVEVDKHRIVGDLGVRYRDLLTLDPTVPIPFPAAILIREKALVVNLETVRMIICSNQCYVLSVPKATDPRVATFPCMDNPFVRQLSKCLRTGKSTATLHDFSRNSASFDFDAPYELRALEVALATVSNLIDRQAFELEREAYPTIDRLAQDVSKDVLEEVRLLKHTLGKLTARVQRIKKELEEILEDDADMQDMYLARRAMMLGEHPPPDRVGMARTQSTYSVADGSSPHQSQLGLSGRHAASEADAVRLLEEGPRPPASSDAAGPAHLSRHQHAQLAYSAPDLHSHHGGHPAAAEHLNSQQQMQPAAEHLGHHLHSRGDVAGSEHGSVRGGRHGHGPGNEHGPGKNRWQRTGTVVRTVRTLKRRSKAAPAGVAEAVEEGAAEAAEAEAAAAAARGGGGGGGPGQDELAGVGEAGGEGAMGRADSAPPAISVERAPSDDDEEVVETFIEGPAMPAVDPHEIEDAEDLLETYYLQVDYLLRRLLAVNERIDDTEDLVAIKMDHRRNELVATDLLVTTITGGFAWVAMWAGLFGMNLTSNWETAQGVFWAVFAFALVGGLALVGAIVGWIRHRRLMFIPSTL